MTMNKRHKKKTREKGYRRLFFVIGFGALCIAAYLCIYQIVSTRFYARSAFIKKQIEKIQDRMTTEIFKAELFFADDTSDMLVREYRQICSARRPAGKASALIEELIKGPTARGIRTMPQQTTLRSVSIDQGGSVTVDFGPEISQYHPGGSSSELLTVMSIVNTILVNISQARDVRLLINGRPVDTLSGHIDCRRPFTANMQIIR
jgi:spore germination protein GerM